MARIARISRCRRGKDRANGAGPRGRRSSADQNRRAAFERMSKLESSGSSTASNEPVGRSSLNKRRWSAPPSGTMACHPSGAGRNSPPSSLAISKACPLETTEQTAPRTGSTVDRASGAQKIVCLSKAFCGSAAKGQPPLLSEIVRRPARSLVADKRLIRSLVLVIAAEPLPGNIRCFYSLGVGINFL